MSCLVLPSPRWPAWGQKCSLRSKRFRASSWRIVGTRAEKRNDGEAGGERRKKNHSKSKECYYISGGDSSALKRTDDTYTKSIVMKDHEILGPGLSKDRSQNLEVAPCEFSSTIFESRRKSSTICLKVLISFQKFEYYAIRKSFTAILCRSWYPNKI